MKWGDWDGYEQMIIAAGALSQLSNNLSLLI